MLSLYTVFRSVSIFFEIISTAMLIYCILSWFRPTFRLYYMLESFVQPFVTPFRRLSVRMTRYFRVPIDFSYWFALIGINILNRIWWWLFSVLMRLY